RTADRLSKLKSGPWGEVLWNASGLTPNERKMLNYGQSPSNPEAAANPVVQDLFIHAFKLLRFSEGVAGFCPGGRIPRLLELKERPSVTVSANVLRANILIIDDDDQIRGLLKE